ncbi:response regulator [bacterium]|nr:response regulator [bacterium]
MKRLPIILVCFFLAVACVSSGSRQIKPVAKNGIIDLSHWDFATDGTLFLNGDWAFYWQQLLQPRDFVDGTPVDKPHYMPVPGMWNDYELDGKKLTGDGYATYRLIIKVKPGSKRFGLKTLEAAHAYKLWLNGKEALANGVVGTSRETMKPRYLSQYTDVEPENNTIELVVQVSNFVHKRGGLWNPFEFGTLNQIIDEREENLLIEFVLFGSIFIIGFYHLGLFCLRRKERSTLYFGIFCLLIALRVVVTGERILHGYLPWLGWENLVRIEYLTFYLGAPLFIVFLSSLFSEFRKLAVGLIVILSLIFSTIAVVTDPVVFSHTLPYFQTIALILSVYVIVSVIRAILHRKEGAILIAAGATILISTLIYDMMLANGWIQGINIAPMGSILFIFIQSFMLSIRFSKSFKLAEELSTELEKKVEQRTSRLRKANQEIRLSSQKLKETQAQLIQSQKMEAMGTLAGGIAHDFNNILGTMMGYTELLLSEPKFNSREKEYLASIYQSGERASELVRQILTFSRGDIQALSRLKIQSQIREILRMIRSTLSESIQILEKIDPDCGPIMANRTQISQVVVNLCTNANHAMRENGGTLEIELKEQVIRQNEYIENPLAEGPYLLLRVSDTGVGMTDSVMKRIFDPFFTTKEVNEGSGLGLSIVHGIVRSHNGFIRVESEPGSGTQFQIFFPITEEVEEPVTLGNLDPIEGRGHILIVEDDEDLARFYRTTLEKLGYQTSVCHDGQEALACFEASPDEFQLVFTDQILPVMTGHEMSREILKINPKIPIILSSGYSQTLTEDEAKKIGIRYFLNKPVRLNDLTQKIRELLN